MTERPYHLSIAWDSKPSLSPAAQNETYRLAEPWAFLFTISGRGYRTILPEGYLSDGPSVPTLWLARKLVPRNDTTWKPALVHDWLYGIKGRVALGDDVLDVDRETVDRLFLIGLLKSNLGPRRSMLAHRAVRLGGWMGWMRTNAIDRENQKLNIITERI